MPRKAAAPQLPIKISVIARTLGVSGQTVRNWIHKLGIVPCSTPKVPQATSLQEPNKTDRVVWALTPKDAEALIRAFRGK